MFFVVIIIVFVVIGLFKKSFERKSHLFVIKKDGTKPHLIISWSGIKENKHKNKNNNKDRSYKKDNDSTMNNNDNNKSNDHNSNNNSNNNDSEKTEGEIFSSGNIWATLSKFGI